MSQIPIYTDKLFLEHDTGLRHPERPARLEASIEALKKSGSLSKQLHWTTGRSATRKEILRCHKADLFELVEKT
ncbi:MAG TPA: histone deacetylase, partial [Planctomycetes bacterium]|nr:histone deacetylase [Planctomycetota bacterium]